MIFIDTNVISELWRAEPHPGVLAWMDAQTMETLHLSAITVAELRFGLAAMPQGKRRAIYLERLEKEVLPAFAGRVLPFKLNASQAYADLMARARAGGKAMGMADGYIAATVTATATATACGLMVATRDTSPFKASGLNTVNPWKAEP